MLFSSSFFFGAYAMERKIGNLNDQVFLRMKYATKMFSIMSPLWIFEIIEWQLKLTGKYDLAVSKGLIIFHICNSLQVFHKLYDIVIQNIQTYLTFLQGFFMLCALCRRIIAKFFGSIFSRLSPSSRKSINCQLSKTSATTKMTTTSV